MDEVWRPIPGYGGHYEASNLGRIRVKDRTIVRKHSSGRTVAFKYKGRVLNPVRCSKDAPYLKVTIGVDGTDHQPRVHTLVLLAFVGPKQVGQEACHNNGIPTDNRASNLRWGTHSENGADRKQHGNYPVGERHPMARLTDEQASEIAAANGTVAEVARRYGISRTHAWRLRKRAATIEALA